MTQVERIALWFAVVCSVLGLMNILSWLVWIVLVLAVAGFFGYVVWLWIEDDGLNQGQPH